MATRLTSGWGFQATDLIQEFSELVVSMVIVFKQRPVDTSQNRTVPSSLPVKTRKHIYCNERYLVFKNLFIRGISKD